MLSKKENILITGSSGQLGNELKKISLEFTANNYFFECKDSLNIEFQNQLEQYIKKNCITVLINCAAFTNVSLAQSRPHLANQVNHKAVKTLAYTCLKNNVKLIHLSTDYVFDGNASVSYSEDDDKNPINYYGMSKLMGEESILDLKLKNSLIIRTSWLYSSSESNFVKKIINKCKLKTEMKLPIDEIGSPTYAPKLAESILKIIPQLENSKTQIYHYSDSGYCSRYEFGLAISQFINPNIKIIPFKIGSSIRPNFSVLNCNKIQKKFDIEISSWTENLNIFFKKNYINKYVL